MSDEEEAKARQRFLVLGLVRLSGAVLIATGLAVISKGFLDLPIPVGYIFLVLGIVDFIILPLVLAKRWKSPPVT